MQIYSGLYEEITCNKLRRAKKKLLSVGLSLFHMFCCYVYYLHVSRIINEWGLKQNVTSWDYMYIREDSIVSSSHNIFAFRFTDSDGKKHDESENDGKYWAGRLLLKALTCTVYS